MPLDFRLRAGQFRTSFLEENFSRVETNPMPVRGDRSTLELRAARRGLHSITTEVREALRGIAEEETSFVHLFLQHTSCGLVIQENADPSARHDLELFFERLVPFHQKGFRHVHEGPDDMPSHIKTVLTETSLLVPCDGPEMLLGTWQGIYLWEHRDHCPLRRLIVTAI